MNPVKLAKNDAPWMSVLLPSRIAIARSELASEFFRKLLWPMPLIFPCMFIMCTFVTKLNIFAIGLA
jgi:hypothetical protein